MPTPEITQSSPAEIKNPSFRPKMSSTNAKIAELAAKIFIVIALFTLTAIFCPFLLPAVPFIVIPLMSTDEPEARPARAEPEARPAPADTPAPTKKNILENFKLPQDIGPNGHSTTIDPENCNEGDVQPMIANLLARKDQPSPNFKF